jgi:hypothetical protein
MNPNIKSTYWLWTQLGLIAIGVAFIVYVALPGPDIKLFGGFFLTIGLLNIFSHKTTGRRIFSITQSSWFFLPEFWARGGERATQLLFLGIGIILAAAGCILGLFGGAL